MITPIAVVLTIVLGRALYNAGRDQVPYSARWFRSAADVNVVRHDGTPRWQELETVPGNHTVLCIVDGWSRGRRSTAHASYESVYLILPQLIREGDRFRLTAADERMFFDGFTGADFALLDPTRPGWATVEILSVSGARIKTRMDVHLTWYVDESFYTPDPEQWRRDTYDYSGKEVFSVWSGR